MPCGDQGERFAPVQTASAGGFQRHAWLRLPAAASPPAPRRDKLDPAEKGKRTRLSEADKSGLPGFGCGLDDRPMSYQRVCVGQTSLQAPGQPRSVFSPPPDAVALSHAAHRLRRRPAPSGQFVVSISPAAKSTDWPSLKSDALLFRTTPRRADRYQGLHPTHAVDASDALLVIYGCPKGALGVP